MCGVCLVIVTVDAFHSLLLTADAEYVVNGFVTVVCKPYFAGSLSQGCCVLTHACVSVKGVSSVCKFRGHV